MTTNAAKIIIDADDLASKKFAIAAANAEKNIKHIKDVGGKAKASTEFFGQLANVLGGTQLAGYAGQMAGLTEKVGRFSEVSKVGTAGALAFKAGLVGMAAVITYQVTTAVASMVYELDKLESKMKKTAESGIDSFNKLAATRQRIFQERLEDVDLRAQLAGSGADPVAERKRIQSELQTEIAKTTQEINKATAEIEAYEAQWLKLDPVQTAFIESEKERIGAMKSAISQMQAMSQQLRSDLSERKKNNDAIREQIELQKEQERERQQALAATERERERVADMLKKETDRITEQRIELEKGKEAAHAFALEMQGLAKADAERIARDQAEIDAIKEKNALKDQSKDTEIGVQAFESRLLTRGPAVNKALEIATKQLDELKKIKDKLPMHSTPSQRLQIAVVG